MPEHPVNKPLTANEAVDTLCLRVAQYIAKGACWTCAVKLVSHETGVEYRKALDLWLARDIAAEKG